MMEIGGTKLGSATKPSVCQYFFFLVKDRGKLNKNTIDEAQGLWDSLKILYNIDGSLPRIERSIEDLKQVDDADLFIKRLGVLKKLDGLVTARQLIFNEVLIFNIGIETKDDYETDTPELDWDRQLEIEIPANDLGNILGLASVLVTISNKFRDILMAVRTKMPFAQNQTIHYCTFNFGHLWRFGNSNKYLFVIKPEETKNEKFKKFIVRDFPYILTLNQIINEDYKSFLQLERDIQNIEKQLEQHTQELQKLNQESDTLVLAIRKDHMEELGHEILKIKYNIIKCTDQIKINRINLHAVIKRLKVIHDEIFSEDINNTNDHFNYAQKWLLSNNEKFKLLSIEIDKYCNEVTKLIEVLENGTKETVLKPKIYTTANESSEAIPIVKSPYKNQRNGFLANNKIEAKILDSIPLEWGSSYVLLEPEPSRSLKIFKKLITKRFMGLCVTKEEREQLIKELQLNYDNIFQINPELGEKTIPPVLSKISHLINEFLSLNIHSIIYLDGIDYLINFNDFNRVLKFSNNINESIILNDSILIISLNNSKLNKDQITSFLKNAIDITNYEVGLEDLE